MAFGVTLDKGKTWTEATDNQEIWTGYHDNGTWVISMKYGGTGSGSSTGGTGGGGSTNTGLDYWGVKCIYPTIANGRVWNAPLDKGVNRTIRAGQRDGTNELCPLGDANYTIDVNAKTLNMVGGAPRAYVYDAQRIKMFENVEITCYYKMVSPTSSIASYQGFELSCRGQHELQRGNDKVQTYYIRHAINGQYFRMKEDVHPNSSDTVVKTGVTFNKNVWYGMKFIVRNAGSGVKIEGYMDTTDGANGGNWVKMVDWTDTNNPYTSKNSGCHSSFARTDNSNGFLVKKWSIREVGPVS